MIEPGDGPPARVKDGRSIPEEMLRRVQGEFLEMPGLRVTEAQARRLWGLDAATCSDVLSALIDAGFLFRTRDGAFMRMEPATPAKAPWHYEQSESQRHSVTRGPCRYRWHSVGVVASRTSAPRQRIPRHKSRPSRLSSEIHGVCRGTQSCSGISRGTRIRPSCPSPRALIDRDVPARSHPGHHTQAFVLDIREGHPGARERSERQRS